MSSICPFLSTSRWWKRITPSKDEPRQRSCQSKRNSSLVRDLSSERDMKKDLITFSYSRLLIALLSLACFIVISWINITVFNMKLFMLLNECCSLFENYLEISLNIYICNEIFLVLENSTYDYICIYTWNAYSRFLSNSKKTCRNSESDSL